MMFTNDELQELIEDFEDGIREASQIVCSDTDTRSEIANHICDAVDKMDTRHRIIRISLKEYDTFSKVLRQLLLLCASDAKFSKNDADLNKELLYGFAEEKLLYSKVMEVLKYDFSNKGIRVLILLEDFELAGKQWKADQFGLMRAIYTDPKNTSMMIISDRTAIEVSKEPLGSSPFCNIFVDMIKIVEGNVL